MSKVGQRPSPTIADFLQRRRKQLGLTLREVQEKTAKMGTLIPFATLAKVEQGKADPGFRRLHILLKLYHVPLQMAGDLLDLEEMAVDVPLDSEPEALYRQGIAAWQRGDIREGLSLLLALRQRLPGDPEHRLLRQKSLLSFSIAVGSLGKYSLARHIVEDLILEPPEPALVVPVMVQAAVCWHWLGSGEVALGLLYRAEFHVEPDAHRNRAWIQHERASILTGMSDFGPAAAALKQAIECYRRAGDVYGESRALGSLTRLRLARGDGAGALLAARKARRHARRHGFERLEVLRTIDEGRAHLLLGDAVSGLSRLNEALAACLATDDKAGEFYGHYYLWKTHLALGNLERARIERTSALYFVQFVNEATEEAAEARSSRSMKERT